MRPRGLAKKTKRDWRRPEIQPIHASPHSKKRGDNHGDHRRTHHRSARERGGGGFIGDLASGLIGGLFGGGGLTADPFPGTTGRARGGRVYAGRAYTVGERGREWFTPDENGFVGAGAGGGGMTVNIDARGADAAQLRRVEKAIRDLNAGFERRVDGRVMDSSRRGGDFKRVTGR